MKTWKMASNSCLMLAVLSVYSSGVWADQFYKWVDASGATHYSATPPPPNSKSKAKTISIASQKPKSDSQNASALMAEPVSASSQASSGQNTGDQHSADQLEKLRNLKKQAIHGIDKDPSLRVSLAGGNTATLDDFNAAYRQRTGQDLISKDKPVSSMTPEEMSSTMRKYMNSLQNK